MNSEYLLVITQDLSLLPSEISNKYELFVDNVLFKY